jgi:septal ring factor EnvC (AmiA/AmiB activator)
MKRAILNKLNAEASPAKILAEKILFKSLSQSLQSLRERIQHNKKSEDELNQLIKDFQDYSKTEVELATFLNELENKKKTVVDNYLGEIEKEKELQKRFSKLKVQFAMARAQARKDLGTRFQSPLKGFTKFEHKNKGITFYYDGRRPVTSSAAGEIVYSGELSAYGNVVMIDHGDDTRSVVLGQFIPKVSKGLMVKVGDVLGYTSYNPRREKNNGKVYFEVRKKNKVQNTIELMNASSLDREVLASR